MENEIINTAEAAKLLKSSKKTLLRNIEAGVYPKGVCGKHGRYWLFNKQKLIEFVFNLN